MTLSKLLKKKQLQKTAKSKKYLIAQHKPTLYADQVNKSFIKEPLSLQIKLDHKITKSMHMIHEFK